MRDRTTVVLVVVGVLALVGGGFLAYLTLFHDSDTTTTATPRSTPRLETTRFVSRKGGFSLQVPKGLKAARNGRTARFTSRDKGLVVSVGPGGEGTLKAASATLVQRVRETYSEVKVLGRRVERVDGRRALSTYGRASNADKVPLRFVVLVVRAEPRTFALTAFTASRSDPRKVLPVVNELAGSFHVLPRKPAKKR